MVKGLIVRYDFHCINYFIDLFMDVYCCQFHVEGTCLFTRQQDDRAGINEKRRTRCGIHTVLVKVCNITLYLLYSQYLI